MERLSMLTKRELINKQKHAYQRATKKGKSGILDALVLSTQLSRDHLIRVLQAEYPYQGKKVAPGRGRKPVYTKEHQRILLQVWELLNYPSSRRLKEAMTDVLDNLERFGHLSCTEECRKQMQSMSHGTMDRLLAKKRRALNPFGRSTTKPGTLLKEQIPIRRGTDWDDSTLGFLEIDLVAHCGSSTRGEYVNTLDATDVCSGWTECQAVRNKARVHTLNAMKCIEQRLPFPLLGIDSDNGSEFINDHFLYWAKERNLVFTRGRANHSNDSCYVEQKNWTVVRHSVGYQRFEGEDTVALLNEFYAHLRLIINYFTPSQKLLERERMGSKIRKKHDKPTTPYHRILQNPEVDQQVKDKLRHEFLSIDLLETRKKMDLLLANIHASGLGY